MNHKQTSLVGLLLMAVAVALGALAWRTPPRRTDTVPQQDRLIHKRAVELLRGIASKSPRADDGEKEIRRELYEQYRWTVRDLEARWPQQATGEDWPDL